MAKVKNLYVGKGFYDYGEKGMEDRGVAIETITYPSIPKKTKMHGYNAYCAIEQKGKVLGRKEKCPTSSWQEDIEKLAPGLKGSLFGFGPYKDVSITGVNSKGFSTTATATAKSSNGITCTFNDKISVYLSSINLNKFKTWMREWGHKFGLKKKGKVWISNAEWKNFILNMLLPFSIDKSVKTMKVPATSTNFVMTRTNATIVYDEVKEMMQNYLLNNLGLTVGVYLGI